MCVCWVGGWEREGCQKGEEKAKKCLDTDRKKKKKNVSFLLAHPALRPTAKNKTSAAMAAAEAPAPPPDSAAAAEAKKRANEDFVGALCAGAERLGGCTENGAPFCAATRGTPGAGTVLCVARGQCGGGRERGAGERKPRGTRSIDRRQRTLPTPPAKRYAKAVAGYTAALALDPASAILYANRSAAHARLENFGSALADATRAVETDPTYVKAYYRRADAAAGLGRVKDALKDYRAAARVAPRDPDLRRKLAAAEKEVTRLRFEAAIAVPDADAGCVADRVDLDTMPVEADYNGPRMDPHPSVEGRHIVTQEFVDAMISAFKAQQTIHRRYAFEIVLAAGDVLRSLPTVVDVDVPDDTHITVCGDVHGQFFDLLHIFDVNGLPSPANPYVFNGDMVDRGSCSAEVVLTLFALKVVHPHSLHLARGNHESASMNKIYGFDGEVRAKYTALLADLFRETFCALPLAHVIGKKVFVVHGGLFARDGVTLDDLRAVDRFREPPEEGLMCEALWSDPQPEPGRAPSKRGVGCQFGPDVTADFLKANGLSLVVRSHEVKEDGYSIDHPDGCVTVFSAPNYCGAGNAAAFVRFTAPSFTPRFTRIAESHPNPVRPMAYSSMFMGGLMGF